MSKAVLRHPECEHRVTEIETLLSNHIPHVNARLKRMERVLWAIATAMFGLLIYMIQGHVRF